MTIDTSATSGCPMMSATIETVSAPVEEALDGAHRMKEGAQPTVVEVAERLRPAGLGVDRAVHVAT
jgi:hypothetical protein